MNLVYFTAGESLFDGEIRRQCLRIPEVLTALREAQQSHNGTWDLMSAATLDDQFDALSDERTHELIRIIQGGLFERFGRMRIVYSEMLARRDFRSSQAVVNEFRWQLRTGEPLTIYVIGPGFDEIPRMLSDRRAHFVDIIDQDPQLDWFWPNLKRAANA